MTPIMTQGKIICYQLYKKASFSVDLSSSDLGRKWERSTLHIHDIIKHAGCLMNMDYLKTWLTPRRYIKQNSMRDSPSYNLTVAQPYNKHSYFYGNQRLFTIFTTANYWILLNAK
jgi:hypothetical protein